MLLNSSTLSVKFKIAVTGMQLLKITSTVENLRKNMCIITTNLYWWKELWLNIQKHYLGLLKQIQLDLTGYSKFECNSVFQRCLVYILFSRHAKFGSFGNKFFTSNDTPFFKILLAYRIKSTVLIASTIVLNGQWLLIVPS